MKPMDAGFDELNRRHASLISS